MVWPRLNLGFNLKNLEPSLLFGSLNGPSFETMVDEALL